MEISCQFQATADLPLQKEPLVSSEQEAAKTSLERTKIDFSYREIESNNHRQNVKHETAP